MPSSPRFPSLRSLLSISSLLPMSVACLLLLASACSGDAKGPEDTEHSSTQTESTPAQKEGSSIPAPADSPSTSRKGSPPPLSAQDLLGAALKGQGNTVRRAVEQGIGPRVTDTRGNTPLMLAAYNGHANVAEFLLEQGARVDARNPEGRTALMFAATGSFPETVELLLSRGADPNATGRAEEWSPIMFAAAEGHPEVVQVLLEGGADPSLKDKDGEQAIDFATERGHDRVARLLQQHMEQ